MVSNRKVERSSTLRYTPFKRGIQPLYFIYTHLQGQSSTSSLHTFHYILCCTLSIHTTTFKALFIFISDASYLAVVQITTSLTSLYIQSICVWLRFTIVLIFTILIFTLPKSKVFKLTSNIKKSIFPLVVTFFKAIFVF